MKQFEFDKYLGPYSLNDYGDWKRLSNYITKDVIERIGMNYPYVYTPSVASLFYNAYQFAHAKSILFSP